MTLIEFVHAHAEGIGALVSMAIAAWVVTRFWALLRRRGGDE